MASFSDLKGEIIVGISGLEKSSDEVIFTCSDGTKYKMYHAQDCCESVSIEDIWGDLDTILNTPIIVADEITNCDIPMEYDSCTWTFYKIGTIKGWMDIRWYGTSNGYYSESVDFEKVEN